jgi:hypothetical protein
VITDSVAVKQSEPNGVLLHILEETARQASHAGFRREAIDSTVGE